jgi:hypothetical protein
VEKREAGAEKVPIFENLVANWRETTKAIVKQEVNNLEKLEVRGLEKSEFHAPDKRNSNGPDKRSWK